MSQTLKNIKIPYPTEGVIRSAQLNDTVAPENSVQLAVNMNFDRVGATQTRPGIETYATQLTGEIQNFGTLNNSVVDFTALTQTGSTDGFSGAVSSHMSSVRVDDTHFLVFWKGVADDGFAQIIEVNLTTGVATPLGTPLEFETSNNEYNSSIKVDATHFLLFWCGTTQQGFAQVFTVNTTTWAVTAVGSPLIFDTLAFSNSCTQVDENHFINFWNDGSQGVMQIFTVNLSTYAVTAENVKVPFYGTSPQYITCAPLGDGTHFIAFWTGFGNDGFTTVVEIISLVTWSLTQVGTTFEFDTDNATFNSCAPLDDGIHFINFWQSVGGIGVTRVFQVNLTTYTVSNAGTTLTFDAVSDVSNSALSLGNGKDFINFWRSTGNALLSQIFEVNLNTFVVAVIGTPDNLGTGDTVPYNSAVIATQDVVINFWTLSDTTGVLSVVTLDTSLVFNDLLYAQQGNADVYSWSGSTWALRRSGLKNNQKARFTQYLNYIWMVNGNEQIGDAIKTSNGGGFGTNLVPSGLPPGDSIQAGFEGRVWIMDSYADTVYYTDIVQFTPPSTYTLTFNPDVNYLKNFSSQDGDKMTALWTVPRALLLFKQNHIYRIYGATSVDAYPAYNVGTFSEESIVETKDGIYFHHSSGFYKFDYNSQPVEISRRVIDFVKAIPRTSYENIVGIWDGYDAVKWTVGSVTVEGVTYTNCQMRYTISTQVWTIYDYTGNIITALISFDNGTTINQIVGTSVGKVGKLDSGFTDFGESIYYESIDRWRSYTEMYSKSKSISGIMFSSENGAGTLLQYQTEKNPPNVWTDIDTVRDKYDALFPNANTDDFNISRLRFRGNTRGTSMIFHGIELLSIQDKGLNDN